MRGVATTMTIPPRAPAGRPNPYPPALGKGPAHAAPDDAGSPVDPEAYWRQRMTSVPPPETPSEQALPDLRNRLVNALVVANSAHAQEAWQRRRRDPISGHALLYLYAEPPVSNPPACELRMASRSFLGGDEPLLPLLLFEFTDRVVEHLKDGRDPRGPELSNAVQPMSVAARYVGLAVSSLDTPAGTWAEAQRAANSDIDIPGRCYAVLAGGGRIQLDRYAHNRFGQVDILSTGPIRDHSRQPARRWQPDRGRLTNERTQDDYTVHTWAWLHHLHDTIMHLHPKG